MKNKKAEFGIKGLLIGLLIFGGFMWGMMQFWGKIAGDYGSGIDPEYNETYEYVVTNTSYMSTMAESEIEGKEISSTDAATSMLSGGFSALLHTFDSLSLANKIIHELAIKLRIPTIWVSIAVSTLIILFTFVILSLFFKGVS